MHLDPDLRFSLALTYQVNLPENGPVYSHEPYDGWFFNKVSSLVGACFPALENFRVDVGSLESQWFSP